MLLFIVAVIQGGFKGCMKDIQISRVALPYTESNEAGGNFIYPGVSFQCEPTFYGECSVNPCLNGGVCHESISGATCSCNGKSHVMILMWIRR